MEVQAHSLNPIEVMANVLSIESHALVKAAQNLKEDSASQLLQVYERLQKNRGNLFFCGVGKSGIVGKKLMATFSSLGQPSFFLHPIEALHGDLGLIRPEDAIVLISYSGTAEEVLKIIPFLKIKKEMRIALVGDIYSPIGKECSTLFNCFVDKEACVNNQAPTTSSTLTMAMGDAMAVLYEHFVGLSKEGFAENHPGGRLGKSLRLRVLDIMISKESCPCLRKDQTFREAIVEMTNDPVGACLVLRPDKTIEGLIVDGDIKRLLSGENYNMDSTLDEFMNNSPTTILDESLAVEGLELMENGKRPLSLLPVINSKKEFVGILRLHDLFKEGL